MSFAAAATASRKVIHVRPFHGLVAACLAGVLLLAAHPSHAQAPTPAPLPAAKASAPVPKVAVVVPDTGPAWTDLTPAQRTALAPLSASWTGISTPQKRKWLALSQNFPTMSPAERERLHSRMIEWASLSATQRNQARLNFADTQKLSTEEKNAQWKAYQALSPEQKKSLAEKATATAKAPGTAPAISAASKKKLAAVPVTRSDHHTPNAAVDSDSDSSSVPANAAGATIPASLPATHQ